jgi:hypothetical protein
LEKSGFSLDTTVQQGIAFLRADEEDDLRRWQRRKAREPEINMDGQSAGTLAEINVFM